jgi:hypothetical protein
VLKKQGCGAGIKLFVQVGWGAGGKIIRPIFSVFNRLKLPWLVRQIHDKNMGVTKKDVKNK